MSDQTLRERTDKAVDAALSATAEVAALAGLHRELTLCRDRLRQPMRVAIVGKIKAGKSTLMNALLGEAVVGTGTVEATFNVNWLKWGEQPGVVVHFKDDRPPEPRSLEELGTLSLRADEHRELLLSIRYLEVFYPNPLLQSLNLIDTPGLESYYADDSANTRDFLSLHGAELTAETQAQAGNADAVLCLFSQSLHSSDQETMADFQGPGLGDVSPLNAIGVLTKADAYWSDTDDPLAAGQRVCQRLGDLADVRRLFYTLQPVCGLLALGAQTLTPEETETLRALAALPPERIERLVRHASRFAEREYEDVPVPAAQRGQVLDRLGQFGVWVALRRLAAEPADDLAALREALLEASGVAALRRLVLSHFGNRAFLIKLSSALRSIERACFDARREHPEAGAVIDAVSSDFEAIARGEHAFQELRVLGRYYDGDLSLLPDEVQQLLEVTGEFGTTCAARLGQSPEAPLSDLRQLSAERLRAWRLRAQDPFADRWTRSSAGVLARSYNRIAYHLQQAQELLERAQAHLNLEAPSQPDAADR